MLFVLRAAGDTGPQWLSLAVPAGLEHPGRGVRRDALVAAGRLSRARRRARRRCGAAPGPAGPRVRTARRPSRAGYRLAPAGRRLRARAPHQHHHARPVGARGGGDGSGVRDDRARRRRPARLRGRAIDHRRPRRGAWSRRSCRSWPSCSPTSPRPSSRTPPATRARVVPSSVLATGTSRAAWFGATLLVALAGVAVLLVVTGLGLWIGYVAADGPGIGNLLVAALAWVPAAWVAGALAVLSLAWGTRWSVLAWVWPAAFLTLGLLGDLLDLPGWLTGLSPYAHVPSVPSEPWSLDQRHGSVRGRGGPARRGVVAVPHARHRLGCLPCGSPSRSGWRFPVARGRPPSACGAPPSAGARSW
ncbi:hypothetical protein G5V59_04565 [Nocardioides sp. W3-2-3]|uniref:hypothetical protein n=1 Tax=Nocardioides convexus TaxID=2712224 RepID=UPI0024185A9B|nr:hypothetical protein [Nocardioides convexus]NGZ99831.1 hypothetical protein [Nocardioides convexus]